MLRINTASDTPPYEQLRQQVIAQITSGELPPGTKLPAVRRLAGDLGIAPNTVARAYRELESAGYVDTAGRNGTMVANTSPAGGQIEDQARALAGQCVSAMRALGIRPDRMLTYFHDALSKG